ncbi:hypothetical protein PBI_SCTP2_532 [Salicola phage SCTP-2]|nr:hypothetical protein PBI_SCTP2_532 [Salicola phage SCTP-2]
MSTYEKYDAMLKELVAPRKEDYKRYDVMNFRTGEYLHRNLSESTLKEGGYEKPTFKSNTKEQGDLLVILKDGCEEKYQKDRDAYYDKRNQIMEDFKNELLEEEGFTRNDIRKRIGEIVYSKAWEDGHSNGLSEVENHFSEYSEMVDEILRIKDALD